MGSPPRGECFPSDPCSRSAAVLEAAWQEERSNSYIHLHPSTLLFTSTHNLLFVLHGSDGKESACSAGDMGSIPGLEDPLEQGTASSILDWRIPWTEVPSRL